LIYGVEYDFSDLHLTVTISSLYECVELTTLGELSSGLCCLFVVVMRCS